MSIKKITVSALLLSVSFFISVLEGFIPFFGIPGLKLGFANIAVVIAFFAVGKGYALAITVCRPILTFFLFGNATTLAISLSGGIFAYLSLLACHTLLWRLFSFRGLSVIGAVCHSIGQLFCACFLVASTSVLYYLPILCAASSLTGFLTGCIMNYVVPLIIKYGENKNAYTA